MNGVNAQQVTRLTPRADLVIHTRHTREFDLFRLALSCAPTRARINQAFGA
jgi:hypothetical protein